MKKYFKFLALILILFYSLSCLAKSPAKKNSARLKQKNGPVLNRVKQEKKVLPDSFAITFYKPTFIMPYYYTGSPDNGVYLGSTPNNEKLNRGEVQYQISLKVPLWKNIYQSHSSLFFAYTQLSYWQAYNKRSFFRETDYEPELFLANEINYHLCKTWYVNFLNVGISHQSNGYGNGLQRGWNRIYLEAILSANNWMVSIKPWYVVSTNAKNQNIANYLGHERILIAYKYNKQVFALQASNLENPRRTTAELTWSFPLIPYVKGYVEAFSGYGQSLIEYNHRTNSAGIGVAFSDWV